MSNEWVWTPVPADESDPRIQLALTELREMILHEFPDAKINVQRGEDPDGIYMWVTVDMDDPDPEFASIHARVLDMNVEEGFPIHVIPMTTFARSQRIYREEHPDYVPRSSRGN